MIGAWRGPHWIGLIGLAVSSCALLAPASVETHKAALTKSPMELPRCSRNPGTLLVLPPEASAVYDTTGMAYELRPYEIAYFSEFEWAEKPPRMLHRLLVQTLQRADVIGAVVTPPFVGHTTHALRTEIVTLKQDFTSAPGSLELDLRVQLSAEPGARVIASKEFNVREPMQQSDPYAGAVAANDATASALRDVVEFVCAQTR
jgi:cholesterol transport system auxiliary component